MELQGKKQRGTQRVWAEATSRQVADSLLIQLKLISSCSVTSSNYHNTASFLQIKIFVYSGGNDMDTKS